MIRRFIEGIWSISGSLRLAPGQSSTDAFHRLDPLFQETGTRYQVSTDRLTFQKKGQHAQDKMSVFDAGVLQITKDAAGTMLHYKLKSKALLLCFLAPLLFLAFAGASILVGKYEEAAAQSSEKKPEKKKPEVEVALHPIDVFLGAPAPEKPKANKTEAEKKADMDKRKPSPTSAYVFAGLFAALYGVGRILEGKLIRSLFRKKLEGA